MGLKNQKFFLLFCLLLLAPLAAGDSDSDSDDDLLGDTILSSKSGFSVSGADMAIADCLATHSVLFGLWQGTHVNQLCEGARMNANGQFQAAAEMLCSVKKYRKIYGKGQVCIDKIILTEAKPFEFEERFLAQQIELDSIRGQLNATRGELAAVVELVEQQREVVSKAARRPPPTAKPKYSDTDRERVRALLAGEIPDE